MGLVIPKLRKHLCADALLRSVQDVFCQIRSCTSAMRINISYAFTGGPYNINSPASL
jgi:hypothetical protein